MYTAVERDAEGGGAGGGERGAHLISLTPLNRPSIETGDRVQVKRPVSLQTFGSGKESGCSLNNITETAESFSDISSLQRVKYNMV